MISFLRKHAEFSALPKEFEGLELKLSPRAGMKTLRLKVESGRILHLSFPPKAMAADLLAFLENNKPFIQKHKGNVALQSEVPEHFCTMAHQVHLKSAMVPRCAIRQGHCTISLPRPDYLSSAEGHSFLHKSLASIWKIEAKDYLPSRALELAQSKGLEFKSLTIRPSRTRWGSCGPQGDLNFSLFLMALEPHLIDYVIWHELAHLREKHHGASFWNYLEELCPGSKKLDAELKKYAMSHIHFVQSPGFPHPRCSAKSR